MSLLGQKEDMICPISYRLMAESRTQYQCVKNQVVRDKNRMYHVRTLNSTGLIVTLLIPLLGVE